MQQILKKSERAHPAAEEASEQNAEQQQRTDSEKREHVVSGIVDEHPYRTGKPGKNARVAAVETETGTPFNSSPIAARSPANPSNTSFLSGSFS